MTVTFSDHAEQKLTVRRIKRDEVIRVIKSPMQLFEDTEQHSSIAIEDSGSRFLIVVYRITGEDIKAIIVYHTRKIEKLISSKLQRKAWRKIR